MKRTQELLEHTGLLHERQVRVQGFLGQRSLCSKVFPSLDRNLTELIALLLGPVYDLHVFAARILFGNLAILQICFATHGVVGC